MVNEVDMDFRTPGLPHSVRKHAQSTSVEECVQKIENHPDRHALQVSIGNLSNVRWTFFQSLSMSSWMEDLMDIDMGKKSGDKENYTADQLMKKCKKRNFQGIHDWFLRDQEFRVRMIENHRDEDLCRRWDEAGEEHMCQFTFTSTNNVRHEVHLLQGGIGKVHGGLLIIPKVKKEMY